MMKDAMISSTKPVDPEQCDDLHTCDWSNWRKPSGDLVGSCYQYRVCQICGAVDAVGEPEDDDDDERHCEHQYCTRDLEDGYLVCDDCDAVVRPLRDDELGENRPCDLIGEDLMAQTQD